MAKIGDKEALYEKLLNEMRRGDLILAVLSQVQTAQYGYSIKQALSDRGLSINEGTLYPLLRRLETQGLLESEWIVVDDARPRRYYKLSQLGEGIYANLSAEWQSMVAVMNKLLQGQQGDDDAK